MTVARACALAFVAAVAVYGGTLDNGFVWDDQLHVVGDPFASDATNLAVLFSREFWKGSASVEGSGRPVLLFSFLVDRAYWGDVAGGYHLTNILLHGAASAALAGFAAAALASPAAGAAAGLLFALHPAQSEAVCAIAFRGELLAALFGLLALLARRRASSGNPAWLAPAAAGFALSLLSKENAVAWPALALLDEALMPAAARATPRRAVLQAVVFALVLGGYAAFRLPRGDYAALRPKPAAAPPPAPGSTPAVLLNPLRAPAHYDPSKPIWADALKDRAARLRTMTGVFFDYARLTVWPAGLQADRAAPVVERWSAPRFWAGVAALLGLLAAAWRLRRAQPVACLGLLWFLAALAPVSGILPLYNLIAERYLYMPLAGAALCAAALFHAARRGPRPKAALAVAAALLAAAAAATVRRVPAWRDEKTLFGAAPAAESSRLRYNRGRLAREGGRFEEAAEEYRRALELNPSSLEALVNLAEVEASVGRFDEQLALLKRAVSLSPRSGMALTALAGAEERRGRSLEALGLYQRAIAADPALAVARTQYARALQRAGRHHDALQQAGFATQLDPKSFEAAYLLGQLAMDVENWNRCARGMKQAVALDEKNGLALANLGVCRHRLGQLSGDVTYFNMALGPMRNAVKYLPGNAEARAALGTLYADLGRFPESQAAYRDALRIDDRSPMMWHDYAVSLHRPGLLGPAADAYENALLRDPRKVESLVNLAGIRAVQRRFDEARSLIDRAEAVRPRDPLIRKAAEAIEQARGAAEAN